MTTATAHHLRLTVRIHAGAFHKEADVALPLSSSVGELLAEITDLVDAPTIPQPRRRAIPPHPESPVQAGARAD